MIDFLEEVYKRKDDIIADIEKLCRIPSVLDEATANEGQPFGAACKEALDAMLEIGERDGFVCENVDGYAGHIDIGDEEAAFGILGHLDVVPCNKEGWNTDPYEVTIKNGKLYGRGVADDKGPLIAGYYAAKIIHELDLPVKMKTRIIFGCNEENGSKCMKYYFAKKPYPAMGFTPDAEFPVVYGEKAGVNFQITGEIERGNIIGIYSGTRSNIVPEVCEVYIEGNYKQYKDSFHQYLATHHLKGSVEEEGNHTKLTLVGKSAHASTPEQGINATTAMCHYLITVSENKLVQFIDECFYQDHYGEKLGIAYTGLMGPLTVNLGVLNYKNGHVSMIVDMRVPHEVNDEQLTKPIQAHLDGYGLLESHELGKALYIDPQSDLVQSLHSAYVEFTGDHTHQPQAIGGGTYAKSMPNCVAFGVEFPGTDNKIHQNNEEIAIEDLLKATAIYAKAIYNLIKK
ncbi:MAG: dipeptidase PepV [Longibaculum muris]|uniref:Succinyl-diaminopimelate desuccinylase n=1 Tax=Longibaculum muris TaxID=1796628 RepID=A0A4R3Z0Y9_9FIRM|nr:dipeptidase PepV [Longibaculum muris]KXU51641.1 putative dipeptidase PepV [Candidatus Stoquefichus sp. KLE1796]MBS5368655.1 dipeptidase PepV [Coprobacillus cateniformis]MCR1888472.1 dipeptidase PepV [Longibaculum muris]MED9813415.1 dipeptidase PepV [Longibaculum muris]TCV99316.1 succinyl-diaminopimelate desuccinylase [Longibaculum muris]